MSIFKNKTGPIAPESLGQKNLSAALAAHQQARKPSVAPVEVPELEEDADSIADAIIRRRQAKLKPAEPEATPGESFDDLFDPFDDLDEAPEAAAPEPQDMISKIRARLKAKSEGV